ncbi:DNA ligase [Tetrabaena socialis]|uniref:DNA ligase n=1 Tax=Tetrabaena socialis TaxID=47790 RepID=A0A2J7ZLM3_9CHLO|nr:DNA ligase [Tetrabaena socialis]|eukprot:PNH01165.1 DNA ligase [Tetrabaena socialis]
MAPLKGKTIVFTGFRDKELQERIVAKGGRVASAISQHTDIVIASTVKSAKAVKAREQGVRVMNRSEFDAEFFSTSFKHYLTHDNGGRSFKVCFDSRRFWVFKPSSPDDDVTSHDAVAVKPTPYTRVFIGRSPLNERTRFSGAYGPKFDGNSMLFEIAPRRYVFVGHCIRLFNSTEPIEKFVSPVGNSDVPYPYAIDRSGHVYMLLEEVVLTSRPRPPDPHDLYYEQALLTPNLGLVRPEPVVPFEGITAFFIGSKQFTLRYDPHPRRAARAEQGGAAWKKMYIVSHGEKKELSKEEYVALMRRVGKQRGLAPLKSKLLVPRIW